MRDNSFIAVILILALLYILSPVNLIIVQAGVRVLKLPGNRDRGGTVWIQSARSGPHDRRGRWAERINTAKLRYCAGLDEREPRFDAIRAKICRKTRASSPCLSTLIERAEAFASPCTEDLF
jgi:hypothetical protein